MLVRDINGRLNIISRTDCKDDKDYYQKLVRLRLEYTKYYKSVINNSVSICVSNSVSNTSLSK
jgi:hypothetical protein